MHAPPPANSGFKRQIVFRIGADDWPLLEEAAQAHGSIQAAVIAGLHALAAPPAATAAPSEPTAAGSKAPSKRPTVADPNEEITAREAGPLLGLKPNTIKAYIRSGRLAGRYDAEPTWRGWLTTQGAVAAYAKTRGAS